MGTLISNGSSFYNVSTDGNLTHLCNGGPWATPTSVPPWLEYLLPGLNPGAFLLDQVLTIVFQLALFKPVMDAAAEKKWCFKAKSLRFRVGVALATVALQLFIVGYWWVTIKSGQEALGLSDAAVGAQSAIILNVLTAVLLTDPLFDLVKRLICCKKAPQGGDDNTARFLDH